MKSSVFQIIGCVGSQTLREIESCLDHKSAKMRARELNQRTADCRGESYRIYKQKCEGGEGWHCSGRSNPAMAGARRWATKQLAGA